MTRKRLIALAAGIASLGGLAAGMASLGGSASSQAILDPAAYAKCYSQGKAGLVSKIVYNASDNDAVKHTACGVFYATNL